MKKVKRSLLIISLLALLTFIVKCKSDSDPEKPKPSIISVDPTRGIAGDPVKIKGDNLATPTKVTFNGIESLIVQSSNTEVLTVVPTNAPVGLNNISVYTDAGISNELKFEVKEYPDIVDPAPPTLEKTIPTGNFIEYPVLIYGDNLSGVFEISFNDKDAVIITRNRKVVTTAVPKGLPSGLVKIKIRTPKGVSTIDFQVQGPPPPGTPPSFSIVNIPPPNYVPTISNDWTCGLFSDNGDKTFVELNSNDGNENFSIEGRFEYNYDKNKKYNELNYIEFTNKETGETKAGLFSSKLDNPCVLKMVLISSKTGVVTECTFDRKEKNGETDCQE